MVYKLFDLNMWMGEFIDDVLKYTKAENPDIITFQEVGGGRFSKHGFNCYHECEKNLEMQSRLTNPLILDDDRTSFLGNATFVKKNIELVSEQVVWMNPFRFIKVGKKLQDRDIPADLRNALSLKLKLDGKVLYVINTHFAWGVRPKDEPYKIVQMAILRDYIASLDAPFILVGDFNMVSGTHVIDSLGKLGIDQTSLHGLTTTLNPKVHYLGDKVVEYKLAVDHCFVHPDIKVHSFKRVDADLSDHCGLMLEFEF